MSEHTPTIVRATYVPIILDAFRRILQSLRLDATRTLSETGLSAAQLFVLSQLREHARLSIGELAELTMTDRSSVADVIDRLVAKGLVRRGWSASDRRRAEIALTASGQRILNKSPSAPTERLLNGLDELTENEIYALAMALLQLERAMRIDQELPRMLFEE